MKHKGKDITMEIKPKVLFLDIESLPNLCYAYDLYSYKNPQMIEKERSIVTFAWKWWGEVKPHVLSIQDTGESPYEDAILVKAALDVIEQADYVVAHYGDKFDLRFIRARALINGISSMPPITSIDTYKLAKKYFNLNANKLDYLAKILGIDGKHKMSFEDWRQCAQGNKKAIQKMAEYNMQDVLMLEAVFEKMLPHVESKLNFSLFYPKDSVTCPNCGSHNLHRRGFQINKLTRRKRYHCQSCGAWTSVKMDKE